MRRARHHPPLPPSTTHNVQMPIPIRSKSKSKSPPRSSSNQLPDYLKNEIYYFFKFLWNEVTFEDFVEGCPTDLFGKPATSDRRLATKFYDKIKRSIAYHLASNKRLKDITAADAPHAHRFFERRFANSQSPLPNHRRNSNSNTTTAKMSANKSASDNSDYYRDDDYEDYDPVGTPPASPFKDNNRRNSTESANGYAGGGKLVVRKGMDVSALTRIDYSKGIPSDIDLPTLQYTLQTLNNVYQLDHTKPHTLPSGVDFIVIKDAPNQTREYRYDKAILILQVTDMDSLSNISARLSKDGKVIIVDAPLKER